MLDAEVTAKAHLIDGKWIGGEDLIDVFSPIDGTRLARIPAGSEQEVDLAVVSARRAFASWSALDVPERCDLLVALADWISDHSDDFAAAETADTGVLLRDAVGGLAKRATLNFRYYADFARSQQQPDTMDRRSAENLIYRKPAGVAAVIIPWNSPLVLGTWKVAAALASGNTVVLKPASLAPLSSCLLAEAVQEVGLPDGVFNLVHGRGSTVGRALAAHSGVDRLAFTGSTDTGREIGIHCARTLTPVSLELGGKSALVVTADSDLDAAAQQIVGQYAHAGQICAAGARILVEHRAAPALLDKVRAGIKATVLGDPRDPETTLGPLISESQIRRVEGLVERARAAGAVVLEGGQRWSGGSLYFEPTLITDAAPDSEINQEEIFGPVLTWMTFKSDAEAIELANCTRFGLGGYVWCNDRERAIGIAREMRTGTIWVNGTSRDLDAPFGGVNESGIGREGGLWGWEFFTDISNVAIRKSRRR